MYFLIPEKEYGNAEIMTKINQNDNLTGKNLG